MNSGRCSDCKLWTAPDFGCVLLERKDRRAINCGRTTKGNPCSCGDPISSFELPAGLVDTLLELSAEARA